ncbi:hypothetical protein [Mucilaginibacter dorajii]|nr:hypothetical protein [Mucilaginibacter dorajii]MCS3736386.1 hypothetical protein [Mucilaginibacter dorajii]
MKMQKDQQHLRVAQIGSIILSMILFLLSCTNTTSKKILNIDIYGNLKNAKVKLALDDEVVFDKVVDEDHFTDRKIAWPTANKHPVKVFFSARNKDTSFYYTLKDKNYLLLTVAKANNQFIISSVDSATYAKETKDWVE